MKRHLLAITLLFSAARLVHAQDLGRPVTAISIGGEAGFPSRSKFSIGYGASAKFEVPVYSKFGLSFTGGYSRFAYKNSIAAGGPKPSPENFIPLKAGIVYGSADILLEAEAGTVLQQSEINGSKQNLFAFSLGPSLMFKVNDSESQRLNVGLRYETWSRNTLRQIALRVAYKFGL